MKPLFTWFSQCSWWGNEAIELYWKAQWKETSPAHHNASLWELGLLGDHSPRVLLNTIIYQVGFFFALRSGNEHRRFRHSPPQIQLFEPPNDRAYLVYREDISKTNQGGLANQRKQPKEVYHYSNEDDSTRCLSKSLISAWPCSWSWCWRPQINWYSMLGG